MTKNISTHSSHPPALTPIITASPETVNLIGAIVGNYQLLHLLGTGGFAMVYKAVNTQTLEFVAVKCIEKKTFSQFDSESSLMVGLTHPNIIHFYDMVETVEWVFIVLEYCDMDLFYAIGTINLEDEVVHEIFSQILIAVGHCHSQGVAHRDLKPENILISVQSDSTIRLADFGKETFHLK